MIRSAKSLIIIAGILLSGSFDVARAQSASRDCTHEEKFVDAVDRCVDITSDDVVALGSVRVTGSEQGSYSDRKVILYDETRGDLQLVLTAGMVQAVDESPAVSYEVEGSIVNGQMIVKNLRPIE